MSFHLEIKHKRVTKDDEKFYRTRKPIIIQLFYQELIIPRRPIRGEKLVIKSIETRASIRTLQRTYCALSVHRSINIQYNSLHRINIINKKCETRQTLNS